ncbi:hypothetical protein [Burkholderia gladioli]|uniref:hypothetical protein n=1 Tax=Burkholderia gladioli TaxID=28095 RepID=UPI00163F507C|nr:hypothetical protein [Burkholderia gladioli]
MKLSEGVQWLAREIAGFAELEAFEACCRDAAGSAGREAAALLMIARAAAAFAERQDGVAVQAATMHAFLTRLHAEARQLNEASERSDAALFEALNRFAANLSRADFCLNCL